MKISDAKKALLLLSLLVLLLTAIISIPIKKVNAATGMVPRLNASGVKVADGSNVSYEAEKVVQDGSGGYIIVWRNPLVGNEEIYAQKINSDGVKQWGSDGINVSNEPNAPQRDARIASDGLGGAYIFWVDQRNFDLGVHGYEIYGQEIDSNGNITWGEEGIQFFTPIDGTNVWLTDVITDGGNVYLSYYYNGQGFLKKIDIDGTELWTQTIFDLGFNEFYKNINLTLDSSGGVFAQWYDNGIKIQKYAWDGTPQWTVGPTQVSNSYFSFTSEDIYAQSDGSGGIYITWCFSPDGNPNLTYVQHLDILNTKQWGNDGTQIFSALTKSAPMDMITDGSGSLFITALDESTGSKKAVIDKIDNTGTSSWSTSGINLSTAGGESSPERETLIINDSGGVVATWMDSRYSGSLALGASTYIQNLDSNGASIWEDNGLSFSINGTVYPKTFINSYSGVDIIWVDLGWESNGMLFQSLEPGSGHYITTNNPLDPTDPNFNSVKPGSSYSLSKTDEKVKLIDATDSSILTDVTVDMTSDRDWTTVGGDSDLVDKKAVISNLNGAPGAAATHSLYIPKGTNDQFVKICPDALNISDIDLTCTNGYELTESSPNVRVVTVFGKDYWRVDQLTGTGGLSGAYNTYGSNEITVAGNIDATDANGDSVASGSGNGLDGTNNLVRVFDLDNSRYIAQANVDMTSARDWSSVTGGTDPTAEKSFVTNLNSAPGADATFKLLVPKRAGATGVYVCPGATGFNEITGTCSGGYALRTGDAALSTITLGQDYWVISELSDVSVGAMNYDVTSIEVTPSSTIITSGDTISVTVNAKDSLGNTASYYRGSIYFLTWDDPDAVLPADYTFTEGDNGTHVFNNVQFFHVGTVGVSVTDWADNNIWTPFNITVNAIPQVLGSFVVETSASSPKAGAPFNITVTVKDTLGATFTTYTGTIHFTSTDPDAVLPNDYTFVTGDNGVHSFSGYKFNNEGTQSITVSDTSDNSKTGTSSNIDVKPSDTTGGITNGGGTNNSNNNQNNSDTGAPTSYPSSYPTNSGVGAPGSYPVELPTTGGSNSNPLVKENLNNSSNVQSLERLLSSISNLITAVVLASTITTGAGLLVASEGGIANIFGVFVGFLIPKKGKYWGIIIDSTNNEPVPLAKVNLYDEQNRLVETTVSNMEGKYRLDMKGDTKLVLEVRAGGYKPFKHKLGTASNLIIGDMVVEDVILERVDADLNFFSSLLFFGKIKVFNTLVFLTSILSFIGLVVNLILALTAPGLVNIIFTLLYASMCLYIIYRIIRAQRFGKGEVVDELTGFRLKGVSVRIYDLNKKLLEVGLTNADGIVRFNLVKGKYLLLASKAGYEMTEYGENYLKEVRIDESGLIGERLKMKRTKGDLSAGLESPFN